MDCGSLPIHPTHLISHHPTSFCSVVLRNVLKKWCFHHTSKYLMQSVKWWPASNRRFWLLCLSTGWRNWNGCLRTMVITIHKLPVSSFTFLQCLSGTELLNLSATPYIHVRENENSVEIRTRPAAACSHILVFSRRAIGAERHPCDWGRPDSQRMFDRHGIFLNGMKFFRRKGRLNPDAPDHWMLWKTHWLHGNNWAAELWRNHHRDHKLRYWFLHCWRLFTHFIDPCWNHLERQGRPQTALVIPIEIHSC
jgi:hypothetical protein